MRRFNLKLPIELFERIKLMANFYNVSITKMIVQLLEIGYIGMLNVERGYDNEIINK